MDTALKGLVRQRADQRCEYCGLCQEDEPFFTFHIEHIIPKQHGGADETGNLALACYHCNLHKGTNLTAFDPETGQLVTLFHPRINNWHEHFVMEGGKVRGRTPTGRATVQLFKMNAAARIELRLQVPRRRPSRDGRC